jgi:hypothetical protein
VAVRYTIEIVKDTGDTMEVLHRRHVEAITPMAARKVAHGLFPAWKRKHANGFTIKNRKGDQVYSWRA